MLSVKASISCDECNHKMAAVEIIASCWENVKDFDHGTNVSQRLAKTAQDAGWTWEVKEQPTGNCITWICPRCLSKRTTKPTMPEPVPDLIVVIDLNNQSGVSIYADRELHALVVYEGGSLFDHYSCVTYTINKIVDPDGTIPKKAEAFLPELDEALAKFRRSNRQRFGKG